jgi:hypothetical protein
VPYVPLTQSPPQSDLLETCDRFEQSSAALDSDEELRKILCEEIHRAWEVCQESSIDQNKDLVRNFHISAKKWDRSVDYKALAAQLAKLKDYFPHGSLIDPEKIQAELLIVRERTIEEKLFKITRGYWSMPYSKGYGRRLRFVLFDSYHKAVIGIIGLQSPSADLACRDQYFGLPKGSKLDFVNNTLDAYTIGATPAYAALLGGKLVSGFLHSEKIRQHYWSLYGHKLTTQQGKRVPQPLLAITTASAFGRSSIYNRLRFGEQQLAYPLGYTKGYGTIHLEELYPKLVDWLKLNDRHVPAGFGNGPKVRWQNIMRGLNDLGLSRKYLSHGIRREVFIFELVHNLRAVFHESAIPDVKQFDELSWVSFWKERWCMPRSIRDDRWKTVDTYELMQAAFL